MAAKFEGETPTGYLDAKTPEERDTLIQSMLPLVGHIVSRMSLYFPAHTSKEDLISAGVIGLIDALNRYDPNRGSSVKTFCSLRIRGAVLDELRRLDWVPRSVHREARLLEQAQEAVAKRLNREPLEREVAQEMGLSLEQFEELLDRVKPCTYISLNEAAYFSDEGDSLTHEEVLADNRMQDAVMRLLNAEDKAILRRIVEKLPKQQLQVLSLYYMENLRLKEIAQIMDVTESRVSQIHTLAIIRLRAAFLKERQS
jgi:RNA polymerase sigma factor for flagellar operon FliA